MSNRLWSDLSPSPGKRFWFSLASVPGVISPAPALLTIGGQVPIAVEPQTVFRTPATALLTLQGLGFAGGGQVVPAQASLTVSGLIPTLQKILTVYPAATVTYSDPPQLAPTLITIMTVRPAAALLPLATLPINVTQGGNIGFITPSVGLVTLAGTIANFVFNEIGVSGLSINGLIPSLRTATTLIPDTGQISINGQAPFIEKAFIWLDVDPPPPLTWS